MRKIAAVCLLLLATATAIGAKDISTDDASLQLQNDQDKQQLSVSAGDRELLVYNYSEEWDLPHFYPLNTPSGKNLLVQKTEPYPHHRSFWVSDTVVRDGVKGDVYNGYYSGRKISKQMHIAPFNTRSRHESFSDVVTSVADSIAYKEKLVWETSVTETAFPLLNEYRTIRVHLLEHGYLMDFTFALSAEYGDVTFISDAVHYAWPYLRINSKFSVDGGGTLTSDTGTTGQKETNLKSHHWIDYSNTLDGDTEGVAVMQYPAETPVKWLTRDYGTFGPRRHESQSGKPFTLSKGDKLQQRVGIYVHVGDSVSANVAEVYRKFATGKFGE